MPSPLDNPVGGIPVGLTRTQGYGTMESLYTYRNSDGVKRTSIVDPDRPNQLRVYTEVECDAILKGIKGLREEGHKPGSANRHVARVPLTVYEQSIHEQWDEDRWKKWLNDPDNAAFRVWQGRV